MAVRWRAATPLALIFLVALVLLILSVISVPVTSAIYLGSESDTKFGVFGYCTGSTCSSATIGYPDSLTNNQSFKLPSNARHSLSYILIVHVIAAGFVAVLFFLALLAHIRGPSHSPGYFGAMLILCLPAFLLSLMAFLVDVLLFVPYLEWGSYIVLAATVILAIASIFTCTIRRSVVSRKAMRRHIMDTNEMDLLSDFDKANAAVPPPPVPVGGARSGLVNDPSKENEFTEIEIYPSEESGGAPSYRGPYEADNDTAPLRGYSSAGSRSRPGTATPSGRDEDYEGGGRLVNARQTHERQPTLPIIPPPPAGAMLSDNDSANASTASLNRPRTPPGPNTGAEGHLRYSSFDTNMTGSPQAYRNPGAAPTNIPVAGSSVVGEYVAPRQNWGGNNRIAPPFQPSRQQQPPRMVGTGGPPPSYRSHMGPELVPAAAAAAAPNFSRRGSGPQRYNGNGYVTPPGAAETGLPPTNPVVPTSPTESLNSTFTSISQRDVNPNYYVMQGHTPRVVLGNERNAPHPYNNGPYAQNSYAHGFDQSGGMAPAGRNPVPPPTQQQQMMRMMNRGPPPQQQQQQQQQQMMGYAPPKPRGMASRNDVLLNNNPDFNLPRNLQTRGRPPHKAFNSAYPPGPS